MEFWKELSRAMGGLQPFTHCTDNTAEHSLVECL